MVATIFVRRKGAPGKKDAYISHGNADDDPVLGEGGIEDARQRETEGMSPTDGPPQSRARSSGCDVASHL